MRNAVLKMTDKKSGFCWEMLPGEYWLCIGPSGDGKEDFIYSLIEKNNKGFVEESENDEFFSAFVDSVCVVSLEKAASLIAEERRRDEGDYIEGGIDIGRTPRTFIGELFGAISQAGGKSDTKNVSETNKRLIERMETLPEVKICGIAHLLDRGLKYLSTGEIRRTLLCRALLSGKKLLVLSEPFAGLDVESRRILSDFFEAIAIKRTKDSPSFILCMDRYFEIPQAINKVIEFKNKRVLFCGDRLEYEKLLERRFALSQEEKLKEKQSFIKQINDLQTELQSEKSFSLDKSVPLVKMHDVTVVWGEHCVLDKLNWTLFSGEHTLIRGPNGSGKTTLLELVTGDNMQVFCNEVYLFGKRRGSGETIWEIKEKLGIVSYRLHLEYRMVGGTDLEAVILSGFHDSIGLYEQRSEMEQLVAKKWLGLAGFAGREHETFNSLSYGEQRAILIIRAAVKCPPLLILDEPCHGLDEEYREKILNLLQTIAETGTTTLLHVTHDTSEVLPCEKTILELCPTEKPMYKITSLK